MPIPSDTRSLFSNFYMDGEAAFMDGDPLDHNPYMTDDEAAESWRAGWLAASRAATMMAAGEPHQQEAVLFVKRTKNFHSLRTDTVQ